MDALKLFPADLKASPKIADDSQPGFFDPKPEAEPDTVVVDGTKDGAKAKPGKTPSKKAAKKAAKKVAKK